jgi:hypothetical protein
VKKGRKVKKDAGSEGSEGRRIRKGVKKGV